MTDPEFDKIIIGGDGRGAKSAEGVGSLPETGRFWCILGLLFTFKIISNIHSNCNVVTLLLLFERCYFTS